MNAQGNDLWVFRAGILAVGIPTMAVRLCQRNVMRYKYLT